MTTVTTSLLTERDEDIFIIKLHRPDKFNALNTQLREELVAAIESVRHDDSVRAVIIWGGHEVFAAGADLEEMVSRTPMQAMRQINNGPDMTEALATLRQTTIAALRTEERRVGKEGVRRSRSRWGPYH